ncbi:MAG: hypothetical protein AAB556_00020 [Patescibacteria group bacterium]
MTRLIASLLIFVFLGVLLLVPIPTSAIIKIGGVTPKSGFTFKPCADLTSCAIIIGIQVFLTLFEGKLKCLFGSEQDIFKAGLTPQTVIQDSAYDSIAGVKSLTDTQGNFGGQILTKQKCKCGGKLGVKEVMMIGPPRRTMVAVTSGTKVYDYRSFQPGNWVLGRSTGQVVCRIPKALMIEEIGTSK